MSEPFSAYIALHRAARGDLEAQRTLAREALACSIGEGDFRAATEGLVFARMAASQGDNTDLGVLLQLLAVSASLAKAEGDCDDLREALSAEVVAYLSIGVDRQPEGEADLAPWLAVVVASCSPDEVELGKNLERQMVAAERVG
ncbi:hypothetical protein [Qipengyuania citrea]|uniref:hypothetical protein n=1 Tax=Qipengyuania citrea TaxID=225971 RepID=UPI00067EADBF|nr:hypothetical protein [Qipengyuania citrea]